MPVFLRWFLRLAVINPIAVRLVFSGGRRAKHMWIRSAYLAALIIVLLWSLIFVASGNLTWQELARAAATSFVNIAYLQITLICVLAPIFMGGAIAQEASPRTWEVLLTTPLSAGQVVLGNLFGRLFFILALLFCSLPLFALTQYFGGVPGRAIFASYFVAAAAALLVGSIAIALSVSRLVGKRAFFAFYVCVVSYLGVTIAIDFWLHQANRGAGPLGQGVTVMTCLNPFLSLRALLNPTTYPSAAEGAHQGLASWMLETPVQTWCIGATLLSLVCMAASTLTVRAGGLQTLGQGDDGVAWWQRLFRTHTLGVGDGDGTRHRAPRHVWHNPIAWREAASRNSSPGKIAARITFLALGGLFGLGLIWAYHTDRFTPTEFQFALAASIAVELTVIALVGINTAASAISKEREEGHLDLMLTTPITASAYLTGKLRGLIAYLLPLLAVPIGTLLAAGLYALSGGLGRADRAMVGAAPVVLPEAGLLSALVVISFMAFCVMVGLNWSLKSKGSLASTVGTVGVVGVVGGIVGLCAWNAMRGIVFVGPVLAGLSPASFVYASIYPLDAAEKTITQNGGSIIPTRIALAVGAFISAGVYAAICYAIHGNMVRTFDVTVRKLAGVK